MPIVFLLRLVVLCPLLMSGMHGGGGHGDSDKDPTDGRSAGKRDGDIPNLARAVRGSVADRCDPPTGGID